MQAQLGLPRRCSCCPAPTVRTLYVPRTTFTSSSFLTGTARTCASVPSALSNPHSVLCTTATASAGSLVTHAVLCPQLRGKRRTHKLPPLTGWCREVSLRTQRRRNLAFTWRHTHTKASIWRGRVASLGASKSKHTFRLFLLDLLTVLENFIAAPPEESGQKQGCYRACTAAQAAARKWESRVMEDNYTILGGLLHDDLPEKPIELINQFALCLETQEHAFVKSCHAPSRH